jgi:hypothetical protein
MPTKGATEHTDRKPDHGDQNEGLILPRDTLKAGHDYEDDTEKDQEHQQCRNDPVSRKAIPQRDPHHEHAEQRDQVAT